MATTDRTSATTPAGALAGRLRDASFAHVLVRADGEALAAAGLLAATCVAIETPYQVSTVRTREEVRARTDAVDESATTVAVGTPGEDELRTRPVATAYEVAEQLGADPDPTLALAGVVAGGRTPEEATPSIVDATGVERRPGLAAPTMDLADALAHTTLAHAPYSGDLEAAEAVVADLAVDHVDESDTATDRRVASLLAVDAASADGASDRAAEAIHRAIHPLVGGPLLTIGGYADVLCALAASAPGLGVSLALGGDDFERGADGDSVLDPWREHARAAHEGVRDARVSREDGLLVAHADGPVEAVARLVRDYRSSEPAVLAIGDGDGEEAVEAALATVDAPADPIEAAAEAAGGSGLASGTTGYARIDAARDADLVEHVLEAL